ncbi:sensor domain-containing phosphodiesterase, partial [Vibrio cholerae]|nr:sensor domain-containing phosphodiesterase [Vibrio cholerae]
MILPQWFLSFVQYPRFVATILFGRRYLSHVGIVLPAKLKEPVMAPILPQSTPIPSTMLASWQNMLNLLAEILKVPATMVMRLHHHEFDVYCT